MAEVYLARCRHKICACHIPHELCECACALCKARRWERITQDRVRGKLSHREPAPAQLAAPAVSVAAARAKRTPDASSPHTPNNRELADRALMSSQRAERTSEASAVAAFFDALESPPPRFSLGSPEPSPAALVSAALVSSPLRAPMPTEEPFSPSTDGQPSPDWSARSPRAPPASRVQTQRTWPRAERQHAARELELNKARAQAEAALAVRSAFEFFARHSSTGGEKAGLTEHGEDRVE
ncbi:hypothetical protein KFE25_013688 [Diacronema lutheri]|uniref:Uncharacterized protein n=1 Tax=Diacronema lutheri TaxID=2081491 RepID=A0A8J6CG25_DIALT|nr:hypothetical protein KFE25_013688 [Diacronema lutheri]